MSGARPVGMIRAAALAAALLATAARPAAAQDAPLTQLDTLHVSVASRTSAAFPARSRVVQVLTAEQLHDLPVRSVSEALRWMAAADAMPRSPAQTDLGIRGSTFEQVLVMVDGVKMSDPQTGHYDLDLTVPLDRVERIEVLAGPASALWGADAMGGVVNIVTREGGPIASAHAERGTFDTWRAAGSLDGTASGLRAGGTGEWEKSDGHRPGTDYETVQLHGRASAGVGGGRLFAQGGYGHRDFGANGFYAPRDSYEKTRTTTASAGWSGDVGAGFSVHPLLSYRRHYDDFILIKTNPAVYENVHTSTQRGGELLVRQNSDGPLGLAFAFGGELYREDVHSDNVATAAPNDALGIRSEDRRAAFGEVTWSGTRASASAGLRDDWHEGFGSAWSPSVSASADLLPRLRVRGSWGKSFRSPTWTERFYVDPSNVGNPNLRPERSWTAELGADVALPSTGVVRATVYRRQGDDLIDWVKPLGSPSSVKSVASNIQSARYDGLELGLERLMVGRFQLDGSWSALELTAEATGLTSRYALKPLVERALVSVARPLLDRRLLLSASWQRDQRRNEDAYQLLGARARVALPWGELEVIGSNLGDTDYKDIAGNAAAGRAITVGYRVDLP